VQRRHDCGGSNKIVQRILSALFLHDELVDVQFPSQISDVINQQHCSQPANVVGKLALRKKVNESFISLHNKTK
jgi:hypothetical protein